MSEEFPIDVKAEVKVDLTESANKTAELIHKIFDAVGHTVAPAINLVNAIVDNAKETLNEKHRQKIELIKFEHDEIISRREQIEIRNLESIVNKSVVLLKSDSKPAELENDWVASFFDKARLISTEQMQELWAYILAKQSSSPTAFSKRTLSILVDMDRSDAEAFMDLCRFVWKVDDLEVPLVYDEDYRLTVYKHNGVSRKRLQHLESLGLIENTAITRTHFARAPLALNYLGKRVTVHYHPEGQGIQMGYVAFTKVGRELQSICSADPVDDFFEIAMARLTESAAYVEFIEPSV